MKIRTKIKPSSKKGPLILEKNDEIGEFLEIFVPERAVDGKANQAVIKLLSKKFGTPKTKITLKTGTKSKFKIFEIDG